MSSHSVAGVLAVSALGLLLSSGCQSETKPLTTAISGEPNYGSNAKPPADQVAPQAGKASKSPGAPPIRR